MIVLVQIWLSRADQLIIGECWCVCLCVLYLIVHGWSLLLLASGPLALSLKLSRYVTYSFCSTVWCCLLLEQWPIWECKQQGKHDGEQKEELLSFYSGSPTSATFPSWLYSSIHLHLGQTLPYMWAVCLLWLSKLLTGACYKIFWKRDQKIDTTFISALYVHINKQHGFMKMVDGAWKTSSNIEFISFSLGLNTTRSSLNTYFIYFGQNTHFCTDTTF